ncbi:selenium cofactor biosynthesis protein YqeC [Acetobacterium woodii]|uniref:Selenium-dependent hydroxylase accessory protein YqeC n=1 Tax=Acetobacterium woodii (strain ATCC 29683 / DSM 1030 / JCM 2381 / KCTC 1655 / WB1) TaxID=931626 RepID=H6LF72_ACEWD|nr:selenium cofactor biosynthesis protein YqeC [Acetobacterium woodii]AFA48172.1 hypothetical protein Awo_c13880 [Acetobacterium woodii DSM 1030]
MELINHLNITENDVITITGGGGKTSLMFALGNELSAQKLTHVMTTTTKICIADVPEAQCLIRNKMSDIITEILKDPKRNWVIGKEKNTEAKISGFSEAELNSLKQAIVPLVILNEGDGSKRKPYKFYKDYEPSIPQMTTILIHVIGAETLFRKIDDQTFHRAELFGNNQMIFNEEILKKSFSDFIQNKLDNTLNKTATRVLFINKADGENYSNAQIMAKTGAPLFDRCLIGSLKEGWVENIK